MKKLGRLLAVCALLGLLLTGCNMPLEENRQVEDLVSKSEDEMMKVRNLGRKSLEEVMAKLDSLGFKLNTDDE